VRHFFRSNEFGISFMSQTIPVAAVAEEKPVNSNVPAIESNGLKKTYSSGLFGRNRFEALKGVTFSVQQGEVFGLLGPNGAGKTTFIKTLLGIIRKSGGSASMMGFPAGSRHARKLVGYLPEHLRISPHMTAYTALEVYGNLSNVTNAVVKEKRDELLAVVGLTGREKEPVKNFSKGMLQRLGLAQALLHDPQLLILDEPTDGLDPRARAEMREIIRGLSTRGVTIFLNSHLLQEVEMICERVAILNHGNLIYCGEVDKIGEVLGGDGQARVKLTIAGEAEAMKRGFDGLEFQVSESAEPGQKVVNVKLADQADIDSLIDRLRAESVSIIGIEPSRVSLEDAFLELVQP
jgi:ABC-2 type transport system ATP-binding protein